MATHGIIDNRNEKLVRYINCILSSTEQVARSCLLTPRLFAFPIKGRRLQKKSAFQPTPSNPKDFEGSADALEVLVTWDQGCLPGLGEGGGEAVGVGKIVLSFEACGQLGPQCVIQEKPG